MSAKHVYCPDIYFLASLAKNAIVQMHCIMYYEDFLQSFLTMFPQILNTHTRAPTHTHTYIYNVMWSNIHFRNPDYFLTFYRYYYIIISPGRPQVSAPPELPPDCDLLNTFFWGGLPAMAHGIPLSTMAHAVP